MSHGDDHFGAGMYSLRHDPEPAKARAKTSGPDFEQATDDARIDSGEIAQLRNAFEALRESVKELTAKLDDLNRPPPVTMCLVRTGALDFDVREFLSVESHAQWSESLRCWRHGSLVKFRCGGSAFVADVGPVDIACSVRNTLDDARRWDREQS